MDRVALPGGGRWFLVLVIERPLWPVKGGSGSRTLDDAGASGIELA